MTSTPELRDPVLSIQGLSKTFGDVRVLSDVSFEVRPGEVHALLGQNGSGKSTLIKALAGVHKPDPGAVIRVLDQQLPHSYPPSDSRKYGLAFVHQDLGLIPEMTVAENLALGTGFERRGPLISWRSQRARAQQVLDLFGLAISPGTRVKDLPVTARTLLAIARAFQPGRGTHEVPLSCLVLDEPTAALPDNDAELLFEAIARVTAEGAGVVYVTHRLEEVFRIAGQVTILRDGKLIATRPVTELTHESLVTAIVGEGSAPAAASSSQPQAQEAADDSVVLQASGLQGNRIREANLVVRAGEILGVAGLAGSGRSELARLIFGSQRLHAGSRTIDGQLVPPDSPRSAMRRGIALVPEDRRRDGCILTMKVAQNLTLVRLPTNKSGLLDVRRERKVVQSTIERFDIRPADPSRLIRTLSGGNQQKVVLAKWLARSPRLLILDEPVQGIDVGAKADIFTRLRATADDGTAVLVIDSDFENLAELCDRVLVLRQGRIVGELSGARLTTDHMSKATFGVDDDSNLVHHASQEI